MCVERLHCILRTLLVLVVASRASAQERPYFITYDHHLEEPGSLEVSCSPVLGVPRDGSKSLGSLIELGYGAKGWWTTEVYLDGQSTFGDSTLFTGYRWENRFRPLMGEHWINPVIYVEFENINGADKILKEVVGFDSWQDQVAPNRDARRERESDQRAVGIRVRRGRQSSSCARGLAERLSILSGESVVGSRAVRRSRRMAAPHARRDFSLCRAQPRLESSEWRHAAHQPDPRIDRQQQSGAAPIRGLLRGSGLWPPGRPLNSLTCTYRKDGWKEGKKEGREQLRNGRIAGWQDWKRGVVSFGLPLGLALLCLSGRVGAAWAHRQVEARPSPLEGAPSTAQSWPNPYAAQANAVLAGGKLFRRHCADCHGPDGDGSDRAPSLRGSRVREAAPGTLFWFLTNGNLKHGMPSWSRLPAERRWQLVSYLKSLDVRKCRTTSLSGGWITPHGSLEQLQQLDWQRKHDR